MRIEAIWQELDAELQAGASGAWLLRFALPDSRNKLLVAINTSSRDRALLIPLSSAAISKPSRLAAVQGSRVVCRAGATARHISGFACSTMYTATYSPSLRRISHRELQLLQTKKSAARVMLDRLNRWQKFLSARADGLSVSRQRGLWRAVFLRYVLLPQVDVPSAVMAWRAPERSHQDFQFASASIEVKTTTAKQPQDIRITSERQLDSTGTSALFLFVAVLDEREVEPNGTVQGETPSCRSCGAPQSPRIE